MRIVGTLEKLSKKWNGKHIFNHTRQRCRRYNKSV